MIATLIVHFYSQDCNAVDCSKRDDRRKTSRSTLGPMLRNAAEITSVPNAFLSTSNPTALSRGSFGWQLLGACRKRLNPTALSRGSFGWQLLGPCRTHPNPTALSRGSFGWQLPVATNRKIHGSRPWD